MTEALQVGALVAAAVLVAWAAVVALAAHGDTALPRVLAVEPQDAGLAITEPRLLRVVHLALLILAAALGAFAIHWWAWPPAGAALRVLLVIGLGWTIGDLLPRLMAALAPETVPVARRIAGRTLVLFRPLVALVAFADRPRQRPAAVAAGAADREMLHGVFALRDMTVAEVMTPRIDIVAVDLGATTAQVLERFQRSRHARLLVIDDDPDTVVGVLYAKDCLAVLDPDAAVDQWRSLIRPATFVPEAKTLRDQLRDFQRGPTHLTVVVDEFGGTAGLVTLEDILEQIVGEIQDEYDLEEGAPIQQVGEGEWLVQGGVALSELEAELEAEFGREDVNTVGGLVLAELGRVARPGESVDLGRYRFEVEQVVRRRVGRVRVRHLQGAPATAVEAE